LLSVAVQSVSAFTFRARLPLAHHEEGSSQNLLQLFERGVNRPSNGKLMDIDMNNLTSAGLAAPEMQQHSRILSDSKFWWLACVAVLGVGVVIVRYDATTSDSVLKAEESSSQGEALAKNVGFEKLLLCFLGLNVSMIFWGISQEFIMDRATAKMGSTTSFSLFLVMCNRLTTSMFTGMMLTWHRKPLFFQGFQSACWPGLSNVIASWSQYASLGYISFALQTTSKSAKLLPVFLISVWRGQSYHIQDYAEVCIISAALMVFGIETMNSDAEHQGTELTGILLLLLNLCSDSITPHLQDSLFKKHKGLDAMQATFASSLSAFLCLLVVLCFTGELTSLISFAATEPADLLHIMVLCISSTTTQYLISYTIRHFGPLVFTLIATSRQVLSVTISAILFNHPLTFLAIMAMFLIFGTLIARSLRSLVQQKRQALQGEDSSTSPGHSNIRLNSWTSWEWHLADAISRHSMIMLCMVGIFMSLALQGITQEFIAVHAFRGDLFKYPLFLIAAYKTTGFFMAVFVGWVMRGRSQVWHPDMRTVLLPAIPRDVATCLNYQAIFMDSFPALMVLKSLKVLPTMACGSLLKNRRYSFVDYVEATMVTALVLLFVWDFHSINDEVGEGDSPREVHAVAGVALMFGVVLLEALSNNLEDTVYQASSISPAQLMTGLELVSALFFWPLAGWWGELWPAWDFIRTHPEIVQYILLLGLFSAVGSYACTFTVRIFGPAILSCIMVARHLTSLVLSVGIFLHKMNWLCGVCLVSVSALVLASAMRQAESESMTKMKKLESEQEKEASVQHGLQEARPEAGAGPLLEKLGLEKSEDETAQGGSLEKSTEDSK